MLKQVNSTLYEEKNNNTKNVHFKFFFFSPYACKARHLKKENKVTKNVYFNCELVRYQNVNMHANEETKRHYETCV